MTASPCTGDFLSWFNCLHQDVGDPGGDAEADERPGTSGLLITMNFVAAISFPFMYAALSGRTECS